MTNPTSVAVLGLGNMGTALAAAFLAAGHPTTVWNRTASKAEPLAAQGAAVANTVAEAVGAAEVTVICLSVYDTVLARLDGVDLRGKAIVNLTNGTPRQAREAAKIVTDRGASYVDGGIMAIPEMIGQPSALLFYSGATETFQAHQELLALLGPAKFLGADPGLASLYDLALLSGMYGTFAGAFHAIALAGTEGVPAAEITELVVPWVTAMAAVLPSMAADFDKGGFFGEASGLQVNKDGLDNILTASWQQGISADLLTPFHTLIARKLATIDGSGSVNSVAELLK
ncbi:MULTISPECIES: NAD(P)-dependent oxidoreductase [unclassified Crossiella]|uniref:NAD(P)-dependent oxidoreductase n=1 Tax=unclassified Crossiella TaxID=2620835 RepID=UPI00200047F2|nr:MULTISPECIES: NAD(P)-binding domain-containing protein [unclassified Crossiella]MCK2245177.1 NAD(P)-binding domain-containing protein [Crossiella sp. S99.2]MCK2258830.1 NAD(P)-binding domain-containing protein [Crossiella sp. S99.1]